MNPIERSFLLQADSGLGGKPRPELLGPILTGVQGSLREAVRVGFMHSSRVHGSIRRSLESAADVRYLGHSAAGEGGTLLRFEVRPFGEAAVDLFRQQSLWNEGPTADQTAFELLGEALIDVADRRADSQRFDTGMLRRFGRYRNLFGPRQLDRIILPDANLEHAAVLNEEVAISAVELASVTPASQRVRLVGTLDMLWASRRLLKVQMQAGPAVTASWEGGQAFDSLKEFFKREVVIEGMAVFRPSGAMLRIDAQAIALASAADDFFRSTPVGHPALTSQSRFAHADASQNFGRIWGKIPAEESDDEFLAAIDAMS